MTNYYDSLNALKKKAYSIEKLEDFQSIKKELGEILEDAKKNLSEVSFKTFQANAIKQMGDLYNKKKAYLEKKKSFPIKQSYILREDEGKAFTALCYALTEYISMKINKTRL